VRIESFIWSLLVILAVAKIGAEVASRLKQPAVLGELLAGVCAGGLLVPLAHHYAILEPFVVNGNQPVLYMMGQFGAVLLLLEAGLDSNLGELRRLGVPALWVAATGVTLSMVFGYAAGIALGLSSMTALFIGGALSATSVGITARTFSDLRQSQTDEARTVMGAAVADDVLGLIVLAVVSGMVSTHSLSLATIARTTSVALLFLLGSIYIGQRLAPVILSVASRMQSRAALSSAALVFCFLLAALAEKAAGLSPIVGAFAAGLILSGTEHRLHIQEKLSPLADVFIPVFFVIMGATMPISAINPTTPVGRAALSMAALLTVLAVVAKVAAGVSMPSRKVNRLLVGVGMIPRGEVGLIFAAYGLRIKVMDGSVYSAVLLVVMFTAFMTPSLLKLLARGHQVPAVAPEEEPQPTLVADPDLLDLPAGLRPQVASK
jgi:Kef-type K+ transport system membrane component KefB